VAADRRDLVGVAAVAGWIGITGFGGPAAHIALLRRAVVERRRWLPEREFLDLLGATSLLPGPGSTQMLLYAGRRRAGIPGMLVAGLCFTVPAVLLVLGLAVGYVRYGSSPAGRGVQTWLAPAVVAVVTDALVRLSRPALRTVPAAAAAVVALVGYLLGWPALLILVGGGLVMLAHLPSGTAGGHRAAAAVLVPLAALLAGGPTAESLPARPRPGSGTLFVEFLRLGAITFGSGYVLLAFLRRDLVDGRGWLDRSDLLAAVAAGQVTPGPVFTTATFIGYLLGGVPGALVATVGIFAPSFVLVGLLGPLVPRIAASRLATGFIAGVTAAALGLMAGVTLDLARAGIHTWWAWAGGLGMFALLRTGRLPPALALVGAVAGGLLAGLV
jgi:chromate transporter